MPRSAQFAAALLLFAALGGPARAADAPCDVYLLAGQSNMDGRGKAADLTDEQRRCPEGARIFYRNPPAASEGWQPLAPGYSGAPGYKGKLPSPTFGPEIGFAQGIAPATAGRRLALIKGSKGGTSLSKDWNPGVKGQRETQGPCYRAFIETVGLATAALKAEGSTFAIRGLLWHQGESDAGSSTEVYQQRLTTLISRLREDLELPELPVVVGEVFDNGKRDTVRAAQQAVAAAVPHVAFASAEGLKTWDGGTHFDAASQLTLGERMAAAMQKLVQPTLFIIGDSTVNNGTRGQQGWGTPIAGLFDPEKIRVVNRARGGRSSRTYLTEGLWEKVLAEMQPGDYVLMQFGHNDGGPLTGGRGRASLKGNGEETQDVAAGDKKETVHTYGWYLRKYTADAKAKGATPIVLSPVPRNMWKGDKVNRASGDYGKWAAEAAQAGGALFIDLNALIAQRYDEAGPQKVAELYFGPTDHTHTTPAGALLNAECVAEGIKGLKECPLAGCLK